MLENAFTRANEIYDTTIGWRFTNPKMHELYGTDSMPETGENVAESQKNVPETGNNVLETEINHQNEITNENIKTQKSKKTLE